MIINCCVVALTLHFDVTQALAARILSEPYSGLLLEAGICCLMLMALTLFPSSENNIKQPSLKCFIHFFTALNI